jgi:hypothetical protein
VLDELRVELLLGREVLVDERLRDAALTGDVVDRGRVVAAPGEDREGRLEDRGAPLLAAEALARGDAHAGVPPRDPGMACVIVVTVD